MRVATCTAARFTARFTTRFTTLSIALTLILAPLSRAVAQNTPTTTTPTTTAPVTTKATAPPSPGLAVSPMSAGGGGTVVLDMYPGSDIIAGPSNGSVSYDFDIQNSGTGNATTLFSATSTGPVSGCAVSPTQAYLPADGTAVVTVTCSTGLSGDANVTVKAYAGYGNQALGHLTVQLPTAQPSITANDATWYTAENWDTNYPWFHLRNSGRTAAQYSVTVTNCSGNISGCSVRSNPGTIASGGSADVTVDYHAGPGNNATGSMTLTATSPYGESTSQVLTIVPLSETVSVTPDGATASAEPGSSGAAAFTVSDAGNSSPVTYSLSCSYSGTVTGCSVPASVQVYSGSPQSVGVSYSTSSSLQGGSGTVVLTASYTAPGVRTYTDQGSYNVNVPDRRTYTAVVAPQSYDDYAEQHVRTNYGFTVTNSGNTQATYSLSAGATGGESSPVPRQGSVTLNPGTSGVVYVDFDTGDPTQAGIGTVSLTAAGPSNSATGQIRVVPLSSDVSVTALDGTPEVATNASGTYHFQVADLGNSSPVTYTLQVTGCTAPLTICSAPSTVTVSSGSPQTVAVSFQTQGTSGTAQATLRAFVQGVHTYESSATGSVNVTSRLSVSTAFMNNDDQEYSLCAASCFAVTASKSTVPYYTLDAPRSVTLIYNSDRALPRPFVYADASVTSPPAAVSEYRLEIRRNGTDLPFTNGETVLHFQGAGTSTAPYRLAGQIDLTSYPTKAYSVQVVVTAVYANGTSDVSTSDAQLLVVNTQSSTVAKGWGIAGLQRLSLQPESGGGYLVEDGDGSAVYFTGNGATAADYSRLTLSSNVWTRTYPDGTKVLFDTSGVMTAAIDAVGRQTQFQYDQFNRLSVVLDPVRTSGSSSAPYLALSYDANGLSQIREVGSTTSRTTAVAVDASHHLTRITDPDGLFDGYAYDGAERLATVTDRHGSATTYGYGPTGKLAQATAPAVPLDAGSGSTTTGTPITLFVPWQAVGVPTAATASAPAPLVFPDTIKARVTDANGYATTFTVDRWGQPLNVTDPIGNTTSIWRMGRFPRQVTHPDGTADIMQFTDGSPDAYPGPYLTMSQPAGQQPTYYQYPYSYANIWAPLKVDSIWGSASVAAGYHYNPDNTLASTNSADGRSMAYTYNANKQVTSATDNLAHRTTYGYDAVFANANTVTAPGFRTTTRNLDAEGRDSIVTAPLVAAVTTLYDGVNRPVQVIQAGRPATVFRHDDANRAEEMQDANGNVVHTDYNALGWPVARRDASNATETFRYDATGRAKSRTNRRGDVMSYGYDPLGRLTARSGRGIDDHYSYTNNGNIMVASNAVETDSMFHTPPQIAGPTADSVVTWLNGVRYRVLHKVPDELGSNDSTAILASSSVEFPSRYTFESTAGLATEQWDGFRTTTAHYNGEGILDSLSNPASGARNSHYTSLHALDEQYFSDPTLQSSFGRLYHYDELDRFDGMSVSAATQQTFDYDPYGQLRSVEHRGACSNTFADSAYGMSRQCASLLDSVSYTYDNVGNRIDLGATYYAGNRLANFNGGFLNYDADGNISQKYGIGSDPHNQLYYWDPENRLESLVHDGYYSVRYEYNALGQPVKKYRQGVLDRVWLWDGEQLLAEFNGSNVRSVDYQYSGTDAPYAYTYGGSGASGIRYHELDALGNVIGTHEGTGVTQTITYDPWGVPSYSGQMDSRLMWKGLMWEGDVVGLYYMRGRWYDPELGRFMSEDPIHSDVNDYVFAGDDPINGSDPTGMDEEITCETTYTYAWVNNELQSVTAETHCTSSGGGGLGSAPSGTEGGDFHGGVGGSGIGIGVVSKPLPPTTKKQSPLVRKIKRWIKNAGLAAGLIVGIPGEHQIPEPPPPPTREDTRRETPSAFQQFWDWLNRPSIPVNPSTIRPAFPWGPAGLPGSNPAWVPWTLTP